MKENYKPQPIVTDDVVLPEELDGLIERIAENVHEVWAQGRMAQGLDVWTKSAMMCFAGNGENIRASCHKIVICRKRERGASVTECLM